MRGTPGGVTLLVINTSQNESKSLVIPVEGQRYTSLPPSLRIRLYA